MITVYAFQLLNTQIPFIYEGVIYSSVQHEERRFSSTHAHLRFTPRSSDLKPLFVPLNNHVQVQFLSTIN